MATTNNIKILNKDYLAEQLYNYHKKYVATSISGIQSNKQNNLEVVSNHLTWENNNILPSIATPLQASFARLGLYSA